MTAPIPIIIDFYMFSYILVSGYICFNPVTLHERKRKVQELLHMIVKTQMTLVKRTFLIRHLLKGMTIGLQKQYKKTRRF